jgi:hypothetical protein
MKRNKKFDCIRMKRDIQDRIAEEFAGVSPEKARKIQREQVESDPILGPFLKQIRAHKPSAAR